VINPKKRGRVKSRYKLSITEIAESSPEGGGRTTSEETTVYSKKRGNLRGKGSAIHVGRKRKILYSYLKNHLGSVFQGIGGCERMKIAAGACPHKGGREAELENATKKISTRSKSGCA